ncbi:quaternary ammonium compound-resistance protein SugE [Variovorax sp. YR750]|jgi:quaternary ammonium compound-resistance protein SugE|uniref:Guanidinium exporter n=1 Tax=Variovorax gossypii TaxID=1679495 RepID=A0A3S0JZT6_9BURK|nr:MULTISPECIES: multidrug efflux SMR transporter [Variovorax]MDP9600357.1 quaternary ammonium compound-resistance protein SugE [Variovorax paradoxus]RTQ37262.1 multidrug efflux SMR transporter [Variovorax gossypii]SEL54899.1 quaternary ammonium compound-resistance protein SugE [Variovorax sp. YR750]
MGWVFLLAAGLVEIAMAAALKQSEDWSKLVPSAIGVLTALLSIYLLAKALRYLPLGPAYAIWTGIGSVGVVLMGVLFFGEALSPARLACIALVIGGTVGLRLVNG